MTARTSLLSALVRDEWFLCVSAATSLAFLASGGALLDGLSNLLWLGFVFLWLFVTVLGSALSVVRHAERLAVRAWFRSCRFRVTRARGNRRPVRAGYQLESCPAREAVSLSGSRLLGLKRPEAEQRKPMRMAVAGHQFPRAFAVALGTAAAHEATMVQEELQQVQVRTAQMAAQCEVGAQP
jgi:hypothetical protein